MPASQHRFTGALLLMGSGVFFGSLPIFVASLSQAHISAWMLIIVRLGISIAIFALILTGQRALKLPRRQELGFLAINSLFVFLAFAGYILSLTMGTPPNKAILLAYLSPLYNAAMGVLFLKERLTSRKLIAIGVGFLGILITLDVGNIKGLNTFAVSDLGSIGSGFAASCLTVLGRWARSRKKMPVLHMNMWLFVGALLWLATLGVIALIFGAPGEVARQFTMDISEPKLILGLIGMAICGTTIPYLAFYTGLSRVPSSIAGIFTLTEIAAVFIFSAIFLGQPLQPTQLVGGLVILGAGALIAE